MIESKDDFSYRPTESQLSGGNSIIDIRGTIGETDLVSEIWNGLRPTPGHEKRLPTILLYDEKGLKLFEKITYLEEYYLTNTEIQMLEDHADEIVQLLQNCSVLIELGSGNLRKTDILLRAFDRLGLSFEYYALDLDLQELQRTLSLVPAKTYQNIKCFGLHGTYDDGLRYLQKTAMSTRKKAVFSLGSSLGNFERRDAAAFLSSYLTNLTPDDFVVAALDGCKDPEKVFKAYNDSDNTTHEFILNGLAHANRIIGYDAFDLAVWRVVGEFDRVAGRHHAFISPVKDTKVGDINVLAGERIRIEESYKYDAEDCAKLWKAAGAKVAQTVFNSDRTYTINMLTKQPFAFPSDPKIYASDPVPSRQEWNNLWTLWDSVTRRMIPNEELFDKPIKLRNACIFYLGHVPTFLDMKLAQAIDGVNTDPKYYTKIFERGIDPDVDDPENCHQHSEIPDSWPPVNEILAFQDRVRDRVLKLYDTEAHKELHVARVLWLGFEHESMHLETLLYMLVQSEKTLPPSAVPPPDFRAAALEAKQRRVVNEWFDIPTAEIVLGTDDPEENRGPKRYFGWDVEKPPRSTTVSAFRAKARPITIKEYAEFLQETNQSKLPASWVERAAEYREPEQANGITNGTTNGIANGIANGTSFLGKKCIRTVWGLVPLAFAQDWPVCASYDELAACAAWMGGRIPTFEETRSLYNYVEKNKGRALQALGSQIPAVNAHLTNAGVEESPPEAQSSLNGKCSDPDELFINLQGANVGFQHWTPQPISQKGDQLCGQGDFGGVWEWTSSALRRFEGYESMPLYPAYSSDFFDEKHNIVLGGSWATVPRIAGRKSFVNWYQRNYPYVWAGARLVKDM